MIQIEMTKLPMAVYFEVVNWLIINKIKYTYVLDDRDALFYEITISDEDAIIMRLKLGL